jgi:hypothetical protein
MNRNVLEVLSNYLLTFPQEHFSQESSYGSWIAIDQYTTYIPEDINLLELDEIETPLDILGVLAYNNNYDMSWVSLENTLDLSEAETDFLIDYQFDNNTAKDVARRISYMLEHGVPADYDETFVVEDQTC